jgi:NADH-quinone oxidoreductase subunit J
MDDAGTVIAFWALAATTVGAAVATAAVRNLIYSVLFLVMTFGGVAGLFVTLSADFLAVTQVLIYAGAISVLILFAIMLTPRAERRNAEGFLRLPAAALAAVVAVLLVFAALDTQWNIADRGGFEQTARTIGDLLLDRYVLAFEVASVLLLAAIVGAIVLARPERTEEEG